MRRKPPLEAVRSISKKGSEDIMSTRSPRRGRGPRRPAPRSRRAQPSINRAPPLPVVENTEG